jgi:hypothetical protein
MERRRDRSRYGRGSDGRTSPHAGRQQQPPPPPQQSWGGGAQKLRRSGGGGAAAAASNADEEASLLLEPAVQRQVQRLVREQVARQVRTLLFRSVCLRSALCFVTAGRQLANGPSGNITYQCAHL